MQTNLKLNIGAALLSVNLVVCAPFTLAASQNMVFKAGHPSLQKWLMPKETPFPKDNKPTTARIELGKKLFFDPRLSTDKIMSCATCHNPVFGWSDGLPTAKGFKSKTLGRASPTIFNTAFQNLQMWDGRKKSLEDQVLGPMVSSDEMNIGAAGALAFLNSSNTYKELFAKAYPKEGLNADTLGKAVASFERTVTSDNSRFDQWVRGNSKALTKSEINGFKVFTDPKRGNCEVCHSAPNFTDNGFHNVGLASYGIDNPDMGRYAIRPVAALKGAFKTPTLRELENTAPYFHDGSATTLKEVIDHYITGGIVKTDLDPNMKPLTLTSQEKVDLQAFMKALSTEPEPVLLPVLPK